MIYTSDTFVGRTVSGSLGTASDGINTWQTPYSSVKTVVSVSGGNGNCYFDNTGGTIGTYALNSGLGAARDVDLSVRFNFLSLTGQTEIVLVGRYVDNNNWYRAAVVGSHLFFVKNVAGSVTTTQVASFAISANTSYRLHFQINGSNFAITAWADGSSEPAPQWTGTDTSILLPGSYGLIILSTGTTSGTGVNFNSFVAQSVSTQLTDIYVSSTGNDSNSGTQSQPLATLQAALNMAAPGVTIHVNNGVTTTQGVTNLASGTSANQRIVIQSETLHGASVLSVGAQYAFQNKGAYVDILRFEVSGDSTCNIGIRCTQTGCSAQYNYVHDIQSPNATYPTGGGAIVGQGQTASNFVVNANLIVNTGTSADLLATLVQPIYLQSSGCSATNNIIVGSWASGIAAYHWANNITICNNLIADTTIGILLGGSDGGTICDNSVVANNIIYAFGTIVNNNLFQPGTYVLVREETNTGLNNQYLSNLYYTYTAHAVFSLQHALVDVDSIHADPLFVNYKDDGTGDYHLQSKSPCILAGVNLSSTLPANLTVDYGGTARPLSGDYDIGPYVVSSSATSSSSTYASLILADNPIAYYRLDESSGTTAFDLSGNGYNATLTSGVNFGQVGAITNESDTALFFGPNEMLTLPASVSPASLSALSFEFWIEMTSGWQYVVVTYDGTNTLLYLNGQLYISGSGTDTILVDKHALYIVGSTSATVDEVALYSYVLTALQISAHYNYETSHSHLLTNTTLLGYIDSVTKALIDYVPITTDSSLTTGATTIIAGLSGVNSTNTLGRILAYNDLTSQLALLSSTFATVGGVAAYLANLQTLIPFYFRLFPLFDTLDSYVKTNSLLTGLNAWLTENAFQVQARFATAFNYYQSLAYAAGYRTFAGAPAAISTTNYFPYANVDPMYSFTCTGTTTLSATPGSATSTQGGGTIPLYMYKTNAGNGLGGATLTITSVNGLGNTVVNTFSPGSLIGSTASVTSSNALSLGISAQSITSVTGIGMTNGEAYRISGKIPRTITSY